MKAFNADNFFNVKCGDVYYLTSNKYYVMCLRCEKKILLEEYAEHFQRLHLNFNKTVNANDFCNAFEEQPGIDEMIKIEDFSQWDLEFTENPDKMKGLLGEMAEQDALAATLTIEKQEAFTDFTAMLQHTPAVDNDADDDGIDDDDGNSIKSTFSTAASKASCNSDDSFQLKNQTFACTQCERNYDTKQKLRKHVWSCHKDKKTKKTEQKDIPGEYKCADCNKVFYAERLLQHHQYTHTGIVCDICGKSFAHLGNLKQHKLRHTGIKDYNCEQCEKTFATKTQLKAHIKRHGNNPSIMCELCGKRCFEPALLRQHMLRHTGERPAKCNVCGKSFFCNYDLNVHSVTHSNERPFQCDVCNATFALKKSLRVHKKKHSNKSLDHICQMCDKAFAEVKGLIAHMRSHDAAKNNITLLVK